MKNCTAWVPFEEKVPYEFIIFFFLFHSAFSFLPSQDERQTTEVRHCKTQSRLKYTDLSTIKTINRVRQRIELTNMNFPVLGPLYLKVCSASIATFRISSALSPHFVWLSKITIFHIFFLVNSKIFQCFTLL